MVESQAQVTQHAQLLTTTFAMAIYTPGSTQTAGLAGQMLHALQVSKRASGAPTASARLFSAVCATRSMSLHAVYVQQVKYLP
jgi:hypothetical protein